VGEGAGRAGLGQRLMESKAVARVYEGLFRPAFTRLGSKASYADEARYLETWLAPEEGPVLDLACGTGRYARILAKRFGVDRVVGLDISAPMLVEARDAAAREGQQDVLFVRGSALSLPIADRALGAVHCFGALHLFPSSEQALREVHRTLRAGGTFTFLTACYAQRSMMHAAQSAFSRVAPFRFSAADELETSLERMELDVLDVTTLGMLLMVAARRR
jgi:ubiquinone/menaquinone biosynthesis C-methylase UbiE